jgi:amidohydrolase
MLRQSTPMSLPNDPTQALAARADALAPQLVAFRRDLHAHPELAFQETRTAASVSAVLSQAGIAHRTGVGRTGIVADIPGGRPGPTLVLRGDMDALPIAERTGLPFASTEPGLMHACGHDIHTTTLLGTALVLRDLAPALAGTVRLVFQPAEETLQGAAAMIADGALEGADMAIGFHNIPDMPVGRFAWVPGATNASADRIDIVVHGRSGHAAHPHTAVDPIVAAALLVTELQTVVSREVRPIHPAVVTIGSFHGGTANNIIPDSVTLAGSVRALHASARSAAEQAIARLCAGLEQSMRVRVDYTWTDGAPPLVNDAAMTEKVVRALQAQFGGALDQGEPTMGAEDFALMAQRVPACHFRVGSGAPGRHDRLHNSDYQPDESCIGLGVQALARATLDILS